jgi:hypothetical protein
MGMLAITAIIIDLIVACIFVYKSSMSQREKICFVLLALGAMIFSVLSTNTKGDFSIRVVFFLTIGVLLFSTVAVVHEVRGILNTLEVLLVQRDGKNGSAIMKLMKKNFSMMGLTTVLSGLCTIGIAWFI